MLFKSRSSLVSAAACGVLAAAAMFCAGVGTANADVVTMQNVILSGNVILNPTFSQPNSNNNGPADWNAAGTTPAGDIWDSANYIAPGANHSVAVQTSTGYSQWFTNPESLPTGATTVYLSYFYEASALPTTNESYVHVLFFDNSAHVGNSVDFLSGTQSTWTHVLDTIDLTSVAPTANSFSIAISSNPNTSVPSPSPELWVEDISLSNSSTLVPASAVPEPASLGLVAMGTMGLLLIGRRRKTA
jgi:hypothetical protein